MIKYGMVLLYTEFTMEFAKLFSFFSDFFLVLWPALTFINPSFKLDVESLYYDGLLGLIYEYIFNYKNKVIMLDLLTSSY